MRVSVGNLAVDDPSPFPKFFGVPSRVGFGVSPLRRDGDPSVVSCGIV
jgi:hypothetical protein